MSGRSRCKTGIPAPVEAELSRLGQACRVARRARRLSKRALADRAFVHSDTITRLERGDPGVSMAVFVTVLWLLGELVAVREIVNRLHQIPLEAVDGDF